MNNWDHYNEPTHRENVYMPSGMVGVSGAAQKNYPNMGVQTPQHLWTAAQAQAQQAQAQLPQLWAAVHAQVLQDAQAQLAQQAKPTPAWLQDRLADVTVGGQTSDQIERELLAQQTPQPHWLVTGKHAQQLDLGRPDNVRQPAHYSRYVIEPVTFIGANKLPFDVGNVIKYVCRYDAKNGLEDLEKAKRYVEIVIERVKREQRVANGERAQAVWSEII